jgi:beta-glucosidase/6-phospho-beta-glucosidase/beta-galactosidase
MTCRQYSKDMDFVFLSSNCILMAAPRTEREAAKYSEFVVEKYKTANRVVDMTSSAYNSYFSDATENYLGMNYYSSIVRYESDLHHETTSALHTHSRNMASQK